MTPANVLYGVFNFPGFVKSSDPLIAWGDALADLSIVGQKQAMPSLYSFDRIRLYARVQYFFSSS